MKIYIFLCEILGIGKYRKPFNTDEYSNFITKRFVENCYKNIDATQNT